MSTILKMFTEQDVALIADEMRRGDKATAFADLFPAEITFHKAWGVVQFRNVVMCAFGALGVSQYMVLHDTGHAVSRSDFTVTLPPVVTPGADGADPVTTPGDSKDFKVLDFPKPWRFDMVTQLGAVKRLLNKGGDFKAASDYMQRIAVYFMGTTRTDPDTGGMRMSIVLPTEDTVLSPAWVPIQRVEVNAVLTDFGALTFSWSVVSD